MKAGPSQTKQWSRSILILFYLFAGVNHFWHPDFYLPLIPSYLPFKSALNSLSGIAEVLLAIGIYFPASRKWAAIGLIAMLVAFIPSHVYFIQIGSCVEKGLCVPPWLAWLRLLLIHPLLMWWAWDNRS